MKKIYSSGGVGDNLIIGLKIQKKFPGEKIFWRHYEKHSCHHEPCSDLMKAMFPTGDVAFIKSDKPEAEAKGEGGTYINTVIAGHEDPYLNEQLGESPLTFKDHIVIQMSAGREGDDTYRVVSKDLISQIAKDNADKKIVLLSGKIMAFPKTKNVINLSGQTGTVVDALGYINNCSFFIGQDGVLAYYAMMLKKPTLVNFHLPTLPGHYFNAKWLAHAVPVCQGNSLQYMPKT